jgi:SHS2 domain-containing protein
MKNMKFKFLEHTADVKFQAFGKNAEEVFENSALALKEIICGKKKIKGIREMKVTAKGKDYEKLLYNFLEEILYLLDAENFLISKIKKIKIKDSKLTATISGDTTKNYRFTNSAKAITYNEMFIKKEKGRWITQVVVDV